jgi:ParB family transcriptional regulator, chromosome partitioning protein
VNGAQAAREFIELELALVDDPALPSRSDMDDDKLEDLAASIRAIGLQQPIIVARVGDRFEVIAGHRRRLGCLRAGVTRVPCVVYASKTIDLLTIQAHENARREDLNPADEGIWFAELLEQVCGNDIEKLAGLVGEKVHYVDGRLALVRGDAEVFAALRRGGIKIGVAHELNKVDDAHYRKYFLVCAEQQGATVVTVARWIQDWRQSQIPASEPTAPVEASVSGIADASRDPFTCEVCGRADNVHLIRQINVHQHCKMAILDPLLGKTGAGS